MLTFDEIKQIATRYFQDLPVHEVYLFGSYSRKEQREDSDIDIIVWRDKESRQMPDFPKWKADLMILFNRDVDLRLGPEDWKTAPKYSNKLLVERDMKLLYSKL